MMVLYRNRQLFRKNCGKLGISAPQYAVAGLFSAFRGEDSGSFGRIEAPLWRVLSIAVEISPLHQQPGSECNRLVTTSTLGQPESRWLVSKKLKGSRMKRTYSFAVGVVIL